MTPTTRRVLLAAAVVAVVAVAVVMFTRREHAAGTVRITGRTVMAGDAPLSDVRIVLEVTPGDSEEDVAVERVETRSDGKGEFAINFVGHWSRASYRLEAGKPGFEELSFDNADSLKSPVTFRFAPSRR